MFFKGKSWTIQKFGKNTQIEYKNMSSAFSMNQSGQNFHCFHFLIFRDFFVMELRRSLGIKNSSKYS